jgi:hypothetical protein
MPSHLPVVGAPVGLLGGTLLGLGASRHCPGLVVLARLGRRVALPPEALLPLSGTTGFPPVFVT